MREAARIIGNAGTTGTYQLELELSGAFVTEVPLPSKFGDFMIRSSWIFFLVMFVLGAAAGAIGFRWHASSAEVREIGSTSAASALPPMGSEGSTVAAQKIAPPEVRRPGTNESSLESKAQASSPISLRPTKSNPAEASSGQITLNYWNALNSIMAREEAMRSAPPQLTADSAGGFVMGRSQAFEYAAGAIRKLTTTGVDSDVVALAGELAKWYDEGLANSRAAGSLLQSTDLAVRQGSPGQSWQAAERHHRDRCLELNQLGVQLQQSLSRKYALQFPPLQ